jgi:hypothetical protein
MVRLKVRIEYMDLERDASHVSSHNRGKCVYTITYAGRQIFGMSLRKRGSDSLSKLVIS